VDRVVGVHSDCAVKEAASGCSERQCAVVIL